MSTWKFQLQIFDFSPCGIPDRVEARVGVVVALHAAREVERAVAVVARARAPLDEGLRLCAEAEVLLQVDPHRRRRHHELVGRHAVLPRHVGLAERERGEI